jgi:hypothetical protein
MATSPATDRSSAFDNRRSFIEFQKEIQLDPLSKICCSRTAVRSSLASWPWPAASWSPRGNALVIGIGIEIAGVPKAVHGAFIFGSPVDVRPNGAGPVAAGVNITGVVL